MKIKSDYVKNVDSSGRKFYTSRLIGDRLSRRTFFKAGDAIDYRHDWFARYWRLKYKTDKGRIIGLREPAGELKTLLAEARSLGAASEEEMLKAAKVAAEHDTRE